MKTYAKILFVIFILTMFSAFFDRSENSGAFWVGYLICGPLVWSLPIYGIVWLYRYLFGPRKVQA